MSRLRKVFIALAASLLIVNLLMLDYSTLADSENLGNYLGILAMLCAILSMWLSERQDSRQ